MKPIPWDKIQPYDGSQGGGFEELCAELADSEKPPNAEFTRLGDPDGGVECYWENSNGNKYGWQAKYFKGEFGRTQWKQIDRSVKDALKNYPSLVHYYICVPQNLTGGDETGKSRRKSGTQYWKEYVSNWEKLAKELGMEVQFEWWGKWELNEKLKMPEHADLRRRWFSELVLDDDWFHTQLKVSLEAAEPRYTHEYHVKLPIASKFEKLGRTESYINEIKACVEVILRGQSSLKKSIYPSSDKNNINFEVAKNEFCESLELVLKQIAELTVKPIGGPTFQNISEATSSAWTALERYSQHISQRREEYRKEQHEHTPLDSLIWEVSDIGEGLNAILQYVNEIENESLMIISGDAGMGKTHLLCDVAKRRVKESLPTVLLMGQRFTTTDDPWSQVLSHLGLNRVSIEEFVGALEEAAQNAGHRALFMIDAINEGQGRTIWPAHLAAFLAEIERSPWIAVVLSVRTTYKEVIVPDKIRERDVWVTHMGFEGVEYDALQTFFAHYKLELPTVPTLRPEFRNPLFLKILCKGLHGRGEKRLPHEFQGISEIFDWYLEDVNKRLSSKLDYNPNRNYVWFALRKFAQRTIDENKRWLDLETAEKVVNDLLPQREYEKSLYRGLVSEDLLIENVHEDKDDIVHISYERFADHIIAKCLLDKNLDPKEPETAFAEGGGLSFLSNKKWQRKSGGLIEALSIQVPELMGKELIEFVPSLVRRHSTHAAFWKSLTWRKLEAFSDNTHEMMKRMLVESKGGLIAILDAMLTVAIVPDHPYNAKSLDAFLRLYSMQERDPFWSAYMQENGAIYRIADWALQISPDMEPEEDVAELASIALVWALASSNRHLRDHVTKALVALLTEYLDTLQSILKRFSDVDDPYIAERLYAIAYGVTMRSHDKKKIGDVAQWVYDNVFAKDNLPAHIMIRDYARGVIERSLCLKSDVKVNTKFIRPPYQSKFPDIPTEDEIEKLTGEWKRALPNGGGKMRWSEHKTEDSIFNLGSGYYVGRLLSIWLSLELDKSQWKPTSGDNEPPRFDDRRIQRYIFKRVLSLGWMIKPGKDRAFRFGTPQLMGLPRERLGEKYQWIAYHEIMAYISDHFQYLEKQDKVGAYEGPWQIGRFRDIDPSVTMSFRSDSYHYEMPYSNWIKHKPSWWARESYTKWRESDSHYIWIKREDDIPKIEKLMLVRDSKNVDWLNLCGSFFWQQPYPARGVRLSFMGYFVHNKDKRSFINWVKKIDQTDASAIEPPEKNPIYCGEYGWSSAFRLYYGQGIKKSELLNKCPVDVRVASFRSACDYSGHHDTNVSSIPAEVHMPHFDLIKKLELKLSGRNEYYAKSQRVAYDPIIDVVGERNTDEVPISLLFREGLMRQYLKENELTLCWLVRGEKKILHSGYDVPEEVIRRWVYGLYVLENHGPSGEIQFYDPPRPQKLPPVTGYPDVYISP